MCPRRTIKRVKFQFVICNLPDFVYILFNELNITKTSYIMNKRLMCFRVPFDHGLVRNLELKNGYLIADGIRELSPVSRR